MAKSREQILNDFASRDALRERKIELDETIASLLLDFQDVENRLRIAESIETVVDGVALGNGYHALGGDNVHVRTIPLDDKENMRLVYCYFSRSKIHHGWYVNTKYRLPGSWENHEKVLGFDLNWTQEQATEVAREWLLTGKYVNKL